MIVVPEFFATRLAGQEGAPARAWLDALPDLAARYADRWQLTVDGPSMHGYGALVLPVRRADGTAAVLKLAYLTPETRDEPVALAAWGGDGAVLLLDSAADDGVLLLERLTADRSLETEPIDDAVRITAELMRRLAVPAPQGISRDLRVEAAGWAEELPREWERLGAPYSRKLLDAAVEVCRRLGPTADRLLVNEDLHFENVLAAQREPWLVIDPQPLVGDLEFSTLSLLWSRRTESTLDDRFAALVDLAGLDPERARAWTLVQCARNWLWFAEEEDCTDPGYPSVQAIAPWALR
ncbi:putative phosphotransferase [Nocardia brasiliensis NBRC 14402]|uniref:aminoglycoside phosphotransferase family protein n=1 Tax=Nocardia brasiliensis TaxID=37326 RepID=UPI0003172D06|nr:aminoglycoside phosphotransferase family protein [Nocardia brasiliensis]ASF09713.1 aminoglycoside phosphotransferase [Nocardia brasiliensis]GAJ85002.1 putative phosphotransferase [Nocardia brasiliensis NBRC 14402]SUB55249.1 Aminoglycoside/hydroxyurea antibiotic resistance kinase [Nocardia brasiliensis]